MSVALLVLAHGSPDPMANEDIYAVVDIIRERGVYPIVEVGFIDCNLPTIPEAVDLCVDRGAHRIVAAPYFLHPGNHVVNDLPELLEDAERRHPTTEFLLGDFLGNDILVAEVLRERVGEAAAGHP